VLGKFPTIFLGTPEEGKVQRLQTGSVRTEEEEDSSIK